MRCRACDLVYADPVDPEDRAYFDMEGLGQHEDPVDLRHAVTDYATLVEELCQDYRGRVGRSPRRILLLGRWHPDFAQVKVPGTEIEIAAAFLPSEASLVTGPLTGILGERIAEFDIVLLHELLEATHEPVAVLAGLSKALAPDAIVAVAFSNMKALPSRLLRRRWRNFFDKKVAFYDADNLETLMFRCDFQRIGHLRLRSTYSLGYLAARLELAPRVRAALRASRFSRRALRVASGHEVVLFQPTIVEPVEKLSIIVPVFNEERYVGDVLRALLAKDVQIESEVVIVESNSSDSSRDIVRTFEGQPGVRVIYQDEPRGKGNAVRAALEAATGTIVLIQDADFEYDLDDYDALLEPILQRRASFVLGSRSLGLDDWKVRQYADSPLKGYLMNLAQVAFARTFNLLYQQKVTDINTMLKVFRRECIDGCHLEGNGFNFDIELVCKIVRNGFDPFEVPVNYVARSFNEGKKINFLLDAYPSYYQLFRCRVGRV